MTDYNKKNIKNIQAEKDKAEFDYFINDKDFFELFFSNTDKFDQYSQYYIFNKLIYKLYEEKDKYWDVENLKNYISYIYMRVQAYHKERGLLIKEDNYLIFNTNLKDKNSKEILFVGVIASKDQDVDISNNNLHYEPFKEFGFFTKEEAVNEGIGQNTINKVKRVSFSELYFDFVNYGDEISINFVENEKTNFWNHIFNEDHLVRFPIKFINQFFDNHYYTLYKKSRAVEIKNKIYSENNSCYENLKEIIKEAITTSLNKFRDDSTLIVPTYYPAHNAISYIVPLFLMHDVKPDLFLLFNIKDTKQYIYELKKERDIIKEFRENDYMKYLILEELNKKKYKIKKDEIDEVIKNEKQSMVYLEVKGFFLKEAISLFSEDELVYIYNNQRSFYNKLAKLYVIYELIENNDLGHYKSIYNHFEEKIIKSDNFEMIVSLVKSICEKNIFEAKTIYTPEMARQNMQLLGDIKKYHWLY